MQNRVKYTEEHSYLQVSHFFAPQGIQYFQKNISSHTVDSRKWYAFVPLSSHLFTNYKCTTSTHAICKRGIHPSLPRASKPQRGEPRTETDDGCEKQPLDGRFCKNCAAPAIAKPPTTHPHSALFLSNSPPPPVPPAFQFGSSLLTLTKSLECSPSTVPHLTSHISSSWSCSCSSSSSVVRDWEGASSPSSSSSSRPTAREQQQRWAMHDGRNARRVSP